MQGKRSISDYASVIPQMKVTVDNCPFLQGNLYLILPGQHSHETAKRCAICDHYMLVAAMNPCPCGYYGDPLKECTCSNSTITRYQKRISGPLLDRIDIHTEVLRVEYDKLSKQRLGEPSAEQQTFK